MEVKVEVKEEMGERMDCVVEVEVEGVLADSVFPFFLG